MKYFLLFLVLVIIYSSLKDFLEEKCAAETNICSLDHEYTPNCHSVDCFQ
jgi:hypothetical protein